jgi:hypothetical protein
MSQTRKVRLHPAVSALVLAWVVASPIIWWHNFSTNFGIQPELMFMLQPAALAALGVIAFPLLWRPHAKASIALVGLSVSIASSILLLSTVFPDGTVINAALLSLVGVANWLQTRRLARVSRNA